MIKREYIKIIVEGKRELRAKDPKTQGLGTGPLVQETSQGHSFEDRIKPPRNSRNFPIEYWVFDRFVGLKMYTKYERPPDPSNFVLCLQSQ